MPVVTLIVSNPGGTELLNCNTFCFNAMITGIIRRRKDLTLSRIASSFHRVQLVRFESIAVTCTRMLATDV